MEDLLLLAVLIWFIITFWHLLLIAAFIALIISILLIIWDTVRDTIRDTTPEKEERKDRYYNRPKPPINGNQIPFI